MNPDVAVYNKFASRKFMLALLVVCIGTVLAYFELLTPLLVDLLKWTCGLYFGFNVTQKAADWVAQRIEGNVPEIGKFVP